MNEMLIFSDNARANDAVRAENIKTLYANGFKDAAQKSTSGDLELSLFRGKFAVRFGVKCNSGGKFPSYTTLIKTYKSEIERADDIVLLAKILKQK